MRGTSFKIRPRMAPRDGADVLLGLFVTGLFQILLLGVLPSVLAYLLTDSVLWAFGTYMVCYVAVLSFVVWSVRLSARGIHFIRLLGSPRFLPWEEVTDVAEASRRELVIYGCLWPPFPAREMTPTLSLLGHFRIRWRNGWCYYPPRDAEVFKRLVDEYRGGRGCVTCGYDLRAHRPGDKCPECGRVLPEKAGAVKVEVGQA
jgi:hypothetical protein